MVTVVVSGSKHLAAHHLGGRENPSVEQDCCVNAGVLPPRYHTDLARYGVCGRGGELLANRSRPLPPPLFIWSLPGARRCRAVSCVHCGRSHDYSDTWQLLPRFGWQEIKIALAVLGFRVSWVTSAKGSGLAWCGPQRFPRGTPLAFVAYGLKSPAQCSSWTTVHVWHCLFSFCSTAPSSGDTIRCPVLQLCPHAGHRAFYGIYLCSHFVVGQCERFGCGGWI